MTKNDKEWDGRYKDFTQIMLKLGRDDLVRLATMFETYPHYIGEVFEEDCIRYLWNKLHNWRHGSERADQMAAAFRVLMHDPNA